MAFVKLLVLLAVHVVLSQDDALAAGMAMPNASIAEDFLKFVDKSRSPFHATATAGAMLQQAGFECLSETEDWKKRIRPGGRYMLTREGASLMAFAVGAGYDPELATFSLIGAHTDSPGFKIKPVSTRNSYGYIQLAVETYGGGLWYTWFDRDLTVAGRVIVREGGEMKVRLVTVDYPIMRIPSLAIHLQREIGSNGFQMNEETDTVPILATEIAAALNSEASTAPAEDLLVQKQASVGLAATRHPPLLLEVLANELNVDPMDIVDLDLVVCDTQPAAIGGALKEFVFSARLDNLASCYSATKALIGYTSRRRGGFSVLTDASIQAIALFDTEEVGSNSALGARSPLVADAMRRIVRILGGEYELIVRRSMLLSTDMAHAIHPNYASKHEDNHRPMLGGGVVVKTNMNQKYATSGVTGFVIREIARRGGDLPIQEFIVANDMPSGSTIGPYMASNTGIRTVDVGQAQLSMHSVRETCSVADFSHAINLYSAFYEHYPALFEEVVQNAEVCSY